MPGVAKAPRIKSQHICIVDRDAVGLAAVISSYLFEPSSYLPLFLFPRVEVSETDEATIMSQGYLANMMGGEAAVLIRNALARMGEAEYVILAGLNEHQKSFLAIPAGLQTIEIAEQSDIHPKLSPLNLPRKEELKCRSQELLKGLCIAEQQGKTLTIDENAQPMQEVVESRTGIVVIENLAEASAVVAVNYANTVGASIFLWNQSIPVTAQTERMAISSCSASMFP